MSGFRHPKVFQEDLTVTTTQWCLHSFIGFALVMQNDLCLIFPPLKKKQSIKGKVGMTVENRNLQKYE